MQPIALAPHSNSQIHDSSSWVTTQSHQIFQWKYLRDGSQSVGHRKIVRTVSTNNSIEAHQPSGQLSDVAQQPTQRTNASRMPLRTMLFLAIERKHYIKSACRLYLFDGQRYPRERPVVRKTTKKDCERECTIGQPSIRRSNLPSIAANKGLRALARKVTWAYDNQRYWNSRKPRSRLGIKAPTIR